MKNLILIISCFFLGLSLVSCSVNRPASFNPSMGNMPKAKVETIKVKSSNFVQSVEALGSLDSPQTTEVTTDTDGKIIYLNIPEGKIVSQGHVLAKIDNSTVSANLKISEAKLKNAQDNYNRMKSLQEEGAVSKQVLDNSSEKLNTALAEVERDESLVIMTDIKAPFSGVLSLRKISLGSYVNSGDLVVRVSQVDPLDLVFNIPEKYLSQIEVGQDVSFTVDGIEDKLKSKYEGKIIVIDPYIDKETRTANIKATVRNQKKELLPGRFANVQLHLRNVSDAITIPQEALIQVDGVSKVYKLDSSGKVAEQIVTVSEWLEDSVLIQDGLMIDDVVITSGYQKLMSGVEVVQVPRKKIKNQNLNIGEMSKK